MMMMIIMTRTWLMTIANPSNHSAKQRRHNFCFQKWKMIMNDVIMT